MTGPVAAARPLFLRPGSTFIFKQLSGPAILSRTLPPRSLMSLTASSSSTVQLSTCLRYRLQSPAHLYSTLPDSNITKPASNDPSSPSKPSEGAQDSEASESRNPSPDQQAASPELELPSSKQQPVFPELDASSPSPESQPTESHASSSAQQPPLAPEPALKEASSTSTSTSTQPEPTNRPELPSEADARRTALTHKFSDFMDHLQSRVLVASQKLNDLTGYSAIEAFKQQNTQLEADLAAAQKALHAARAHYKRVNAQRAATQREVTTLLARKDAWAPADLERFTALYRQDHELEAAVQAAGAALTDAEAAEARLGQALTSGILRRYHEEQLWSDRIRRQSTWGTWGLMGLNVLLFVAVQLVAEPWKRARLMKGIAAEEKAALDAVRRELEAVKDLLARRDAAEAALAEAEAEAARARARAEAIMAQEAELEAAPAAPPLEIETGPEPVMEAPRLSWEEFLANPSLWRPALEDLWLRLQDLWPRLQDLYSDRKIDLRMRDASLLAVESAVTGAAVVGTIVLVLMRRS